MASRLSITDHNRAILRLHSSESSGMRGTQELVEKSQLSLRDMAEKRIKLDSEDTVREVTGFIGKLFHESKASGIVVGLSGGIDSAVTCSLCVRAVGAKRVLGVLLFEGKARSSPDFEDAKSLAKQLGIQTLEFDLDRTIAGFVKSSPIETGEKIVLGNLKARMRMSSLYFVANLRNLLVAGTGDRSEDMIGYFTKYGDGGVDFLPIAHLYKTQVRMLALHLGLPQELVEKPSSPQLWPSQKATDEIPIDYDRLDLVLHGLFDVGLTPEQVS